MGKKRKLTAAERRTKKIRKQNYQTIFMHGKKVSVPRSPTIDGMPVDELIARNADELWLHQNEMREFIDIEPKTEMQKHTERRDALEVGAEPY